MATPRIQTREAPSKQAAPRMPEQVDAAIECGWGRLLFGNTFSGPAELVDSLRQELPGKRDIAFYLRDPHVVLALAPQELFLDPSHTYRLRLDAYAPGRVVPRGFTVGKLQRKPEIDAINTILKRCRMVVADPEFIWENRDSSVITYFAARDSASGRIIGTVTGIDHAEAFGDPEHGSSLWCLAVDPQAGAPGVGRALVASLADHYAARGNAYLDLSVMHDNQEAIRLYEDMGFRRVPAFCIKRKNPINETLFTGPALDESMNPYAQIIIDEARRRGIRVNVLDVDNGYFELCFGGRSIVCRESLSEMTTAVAFCRCDNKVLSSRVLRDAGLNVPDQKLATGDDEDAGFLEKHGRVVVKPASSEQGHGVGVNITTPEELSCCIDEARRFDSDVLLEQQVEGKDVRVIVIDYEVVAAAVRRPPEITGNGVDSVETLIRKHSRRREAATRGESAVPIDEVTRRCVGKSGHSLDEVLPEGETLRVRDTANLHTGGTIHDVTAQMHPALKRAACAAAEALRIPVVGLDMMVPDLGGEDYCIIEANERPGLANHEPQPTAERFIDLLFPQTRRVNHG